MCTNIIARSLIGASLSKHNARFITLEKTTHYTTFMTQLLKFKVRLVRSLFMDGSYSILVFCVCKCVKMKVDFVLHSHHLRINIWCSPKHILLEYDIRMINISRYVTFKMSLCIYTLY